VPVAIGVVVFEVAERVTMSRARGRVLVLERRAQPMAMVSLILGRLRRCRHHDMGVVVAVCAVGAMRVLDDLEQPVHVRFRIMVMTVLVLVIVPMRHRSILGQRLPAHADQDQPQGPSARSHKQGACLRDGPLE